MRHPSVLSKWLALLCLLLGAFSAAGSPLDRPWAEQELESILQLHPQRWEHLLDQLDRDAPALAPFWRAVASGDDVSALDLLLHHFRSRPAPDPSWLPPFLAHPSTLQQATDILNDRFHLQGAVGVQPRREDGGLDWKDRGPFDDPEWAWFLNRHNWFEPLMLAYEQTGHTDYIEAISTHLTDWVVTHPYPARLTFSAPWRPLEVARRILNSWTHVFFALQEEPAFSAEARFLLLSSLPKHADSLAFHYSFWGGNHLLTETTALATIAAAWPEFADSKTWRQLAMERFSEQLLAQTYPDGAFKELTNHYQRVVLHGAVRFQAILQAYPPEESETLQKLFQRIDLMGLYFEAVMLPDGTGPMNNASDLEFNALHLDKLRIDRRFPTTALEGGGESPSLYFPWAGHAVMRDRWNDGNEWAFFDMGPYGSAHQHLDALHLDVWIHDIRFLADSGRFTYQPGQWSQYFKGPYAHNVILLDKSPTLPGPRTVNAPLPNDVEIESTFSRFTGKVAFPPEPLTGRSTSTHTRSVLHFPGSGWLVADVITTTGSRQVEAIWNFGPEVSPHMANQHLQLLGAADATGPHLYPSVREYRGETAPVRGWFSPQFGEIEPALQRHYTFFGRGQQVLLWAIPVNVEAETFRLISLHRQEATVEINGPEHTFTVQFDLRPNAFSAEVLPGN